MTRKPTVSKSATATLGVANVIARTQDPSTDHEIDPVQDPGGYACKLLHRAIEHGDVIGQDADGNVTLVFKLSPDDFDRLATFDPDGDPD